MISRFARTSDASPPWGRGQVRGCNTKAVSSITPSPNLSPKGERSMTIRDEHERYVRPHDPSVASAA